MANGKANAAQAQLVPREPEAAPITVRRPPESVLSLIERVVARPDIDPAKLIQLFELRERIEASEARKMFEEAMLKFKANPPAILKNKHVRFETSKGVTEYDHATLHHVCEVIIPALSAVGITHRWRPNDEGKEIVSITCILSGFGHSEETTLRGLPDNSGSKNSMQAVSSSVSYLQRYTLLAACGLAAKGDDNDGAGAVDSAELEKALKEISEAKTPESLKFLFTAGFNKAREASDARAMLKLTQAHDKRKKELANADH